MTPKSATLSPSAQSDIRIPGDTRILWNQYAGSDASPDFVSLPDWVEQRSDSIRAQILAFIHDTGNKTHRGESIIETLKIRDSFSWWWMTLFALRRWHDNSNLYNIARIFALRDVLIDNQITNLKIADIPDDVAKTIESLCDSLRINFQNYGIVSAAAVHRRIRDRSPLIVQAMAVAVRTVFTSRAKNSTDAASTDGFCFFDYLNGLDLEKYKNSIHVSRYWGPVAEIAKTLNDGISWFHIFTPSNTTPNSRIAKNILRSSNFMTRESHYLLSSCLNPKVLWTALLVYFKIFLASIKLGSKSTLFIDTQTGIDFTSLFRDEWLDSLRGRTAMHHAILFCSIEDQISQLPPQKAAIYLMENQPWEMALIHAWRTFQPSKIIGVPHAAAKFWELRHFVDPRSRSINGIYSFPEPDLIGVNNPFMHKLLENNIFPNDQIVDLEASSFGYLADAQVDTHNPSHLGEKSVLVFGDFSLDLTIRLLTATKELNTRITKIFRPHPMCLIAPEFLTEHGFVTNNGSITEQLKVAELVIAPSSTSAAVEAYCLGIPVVVLLSTGTFNFSPLRGMDGVFFASNEVDLGFALESASATGRTNPKPYFNIDPIFARWRSLLEELQ